MRNRLLLASTAAAALLSACGGTGDPYSQVVAACNYTSPAIDKLVINEQDRIKTTLTPECKAALEGVIPYDSSFDSAPEGFKDHVTEAFQILVGYPLRNPGDGKILGVRPELSGAIPLEAVRIFQESDNLNQAIFNYVLSQFDMIQYDGSQQSDGRVARWMPQISGHPRRITVYSTFWNKDGLTAIIPAPFLNAATFVHEARHGDGITHTLCLDSSMGFNCDNDMLGAYGFETVYLHFLLQGSAVPPAPGQKPLISKLAVMLIGDSMCNNLKPGTKASRINHPFPELADSLADVSCDTQASYKWIMEREGLPPLPDDDGTSATGTTGATGPTGTTP